MKRINRGFKVGSYQTPSQGAMLVLLLASIASGCTHNVKLGVNPTSLPKGQISSAQATLVCNQALLDYKHEYHMMGDTWVFPFGPSLKEYSINVAEASFQKVDVVSTEDQAFGKSTSGLVLIPRAVKAENSVPVWAWEDVNFTLVVEWTAKDRSSKNTVWLKTITADASEPAGNAFSGGKHQRILMQKLFDDLSRKTHAAVIAAPELKK